MASRRMRIRAMANIPNLNRGQSDQERPTTPKSPAPASPFGCDEISSPRSPASGAIVIGTEESLRQEPHSIQVKSSNMTTTVARPSPSHSPFKTIVMMTATGSRNQSPVPSHFQRRKTPSPILLSPKSPTLLSPKSPTVLNVSPYTSLPGQGHEHNFSHHMYDQSRRAPSPANNNSFGSSASMMQKEIGSGNPPNLVNSSETLRQRLQKGTNLSTSKYSTSRKEFMIKYTDKKPEISELKILHYTFWNPPNDRKGKGAVGNENDEEDDDLFNGERSEYDNPFVDLAGPNNTFKDMKSDHKGKNSEVKTSKETPTAVGPRVKVGPNGELIIDEQSLVVETSESQRAKKHLEEIETVSGAGYEVGSSGFYRHKRNPKRGGDWSQKETVQFYRALSSCGTDFSMMTHLFPRRCRAELKSKFKREDRRNPSQISQALACQTFDPMDKMTSSEDEEVEEFCLPPKSLKGIRRNSTSKKRKDRANLTELNPVKELKVSEVYNLSQPPILESCYNNNFVVEHHHLDIEQLMTPLSPTRKKLKHQENPDNGTKESKNQIQVKNLSTSVCTNVSSSKQQPGGYKLSIQEEPLKEFTQEKIKIMSPLRTQQTLHEKECGGSNNFATGLPKIEKPLVVGNLKRGRPRRVFDKHNLERLPKSETDAIIVKQQEIPSEKVIKKRQRRKVAPTIPAIVNLTIVPEQKFIKPEILRFDPNDPLGLNVIQNISQDLQANDEQVVLDAPNCDTIPHQVFEIPTITKISNQSLSLKADDRKSKSGSGGAKFETDLVKNGKSMESKAHRRSSKVKPTPRPTRYRVPGPGGKASIRSSIADEIEIEITCL